MWLVGFRRPATGCHPGPVAASPAMIGVYRFIAGLVVMQGAWQRTPMFPPRAHRRCHFSSSSAVILLVCSLALSSLACPPVSAAAEVESPSDRACFEEAYENLHPQCTKAERLRLHTRFGLPSIEGYARQRRSQGDVIIAYYWTKIGGGTAFALYRDQSGRARLEMRLVPVGSRHKRVLVYRTKIQHETWLELVAKGHSLDFGYQPDMICVGGTRIMLEAMSGSGRVRTRRHDLCYLDDDVRLYFSDLAGLALAARPWCARYRRDDEDRPDTVLHRCLAGPTDRK